MMVYIAFYIAVDFALRVIQKAIRTLKNLDFDFSKCYSENTKDRRAKCATQPVEGEQSEK